MSPALVAVLLQLALQEEPAVQAALIALFQKMGHHNPKLTAEDYIALARTQVGT